MHTDPCWQSMVRTTRRWKCCSAQWQSSPMRGTRSSCEASLGCCDGIAVDEDLPPKAACHLRLLLSPHMLLLHTALVLRMPECGPNMYGRRYLGQLLEGSDSVRNFERGIKLLRAAPSDQVLPPPSPPG